jgi:site-specific recombinase XerD
MPRKNSSDPVKIHVPGYIVKNKRLFDGVPLLPSTSFDPAEVLRWYIDKVHPLVVELKVRGKNKTPSLLFCGATREPVANKFKRLTAEAGLKLDAHMVRHLAGSILYARGIRVPVIAELLGIKESTVRENYLHIDRTALLQEAIDEVAKLYWELE